MDSMTRASRSWIGDIYLADVKHLGPIVRQFYAAAAPDECWLWHGPRNRDDYGVVSAQDGRGRSGHLAHRVVWVIETGVALTEDLTIDHLCLQEPCVNPSHMEPVSLGENTRRRNELQRGKSRQSSPRKRPPRGRKICLECNIAYDERYLAEHVQRIHREGI